MIEYFRPRFISALNEEGEIEIGRNRWTRHDVLTKMDSDAAEDAFREWVDEAKVEAKDRAGDFLRKYGCIERFRTLRSKLLAGYVIPFVGAGMSVASGHTGWGDFLVSLTPAESGLRKQIEAKINSGEFEEAAQLIEDELGTEGLTEEIHNRLGSHVVNSSGAVCLMPFAFKAQVLTTNFDFVLPNAYSNAALPFRAEYGGPMLREAPLRMANDPHCLLRIHGDADSLTGRVLTLADYQAAYVDSHAVGGILNAITGLSSLLFLGCSLTTDRTVEALKALKNAATIAQPRHYAFLPYPGSAKLGPRRIALLEAGIHPIYYPADDHERSVEDLLISLIEGGV